MIYGGGWEKINQFLKIYYEEFYEDLKQAICADLGDIDDVDLGHDLKIFGYKKGSPEELQFQSIL
jgi:hypothetical protein